MKCPNCEETLVMSERQGIEIDYCPKCRGGWLDKGELDKIIERSESSTSKTFGTDITERRYEEGDFDSRQQYDKNQQRRKKRGGFLGDIFDFD